MSINIINGREIAKEFLITLKCQAEELIAQGVIPKLTIILIGDNPASKLYVKNKQARAKDLGVVVEIEQFPNEASTQEVVATIKKLNQDNSNHGIIVQLPISQHMDRQTIIEYIDPCKDVDGFNPVNIGRACLHNEDAFIPCTPLGILHLINNIPNTANQHVVIIGRSMIVGKPLANLLLNHDFTVTICHSKTKDLINITSKADIVITAVGIAKKFTEEYFSPGQLVIDVGINEVYSPNGLYSFVGDVDFDRVKNIVNYISPVPGGVGPMTIAYLIYNTIKAARMTLLQNS